MSEPRKTYDDKLHGALLEIRSAMSSLHMYPKTMVPLPNAHGFLSETDHNAAHALEHLRAAADLIDAHREESNREESK